MVVAIGTAEITVGEEKHRAEFSRPIQKRSFKKSFDIDHRKIGFDSEARNPRLPKNLFGGQAKFETISNGQISGVQNK